MKVLFGRFDFISCVWSKIALLYYFVFLLWLHELPLWPHNHSLPVLKYAFTVPIFPHASMHILCCCHFFTVFLLFRVWISFALGSSSNKNRLCRVLTPIINFRCWHHSTSNSLCLRSKIWLLHLPMMRAEDWECSWITEAWALGRMDLQIPLVMEFQILGHLYKLVALCCLVIQICSLRCFFPLWYSWESKFCSGRVFLQAYGLQYFSIL